MYALHIELHTDDEDTLGAVLAGLRDEVDEAGTTLTLVQVEHIASGTD